MLYSFRLLYLCLSLTVLQSSPALTQLLVPLSNLTTDNGTTTESPSNVFGINCLSTMTRYGRPYSQSCAEALIQMPSDGLARTFHSDQRPLPFEARAGDCLVRVEILPTADPVRTSWLYVQTAATQLMVGCLRVYDHAFIKTGGAVMVGHERSQLQITLAKA